MKTNYPGINYAGGQPVNINAETGIRYGIINSNHINPDAFEDIVQNGTDEDFAAYVAEIKNNLKNALADVFSERGGVAGESPLDLAVEAAFEAISDGVSDRYMGGDGCTRYSYDREGYVIQNASDGDMFICKSPYFTYAQFCSPCAPGACYLLNPLEAPREENKCYCLGLDWFDEENECPYPVYSVETGKQI